MNKRIKTARFTELTGISKTTFYDRFRWSSKWIRKLDMRIEEDTGRLTMDEDAVREFARRRRGSLADEASHRAGSLGDHASRTTDDAPPEPPT